VEKREENKLQTTNSGNSNFRKDKQTIRKEGNVQYIQ
jgi:hypothetical protein